MLLWDFIRNYSGVREKDKLGVCGFQIHLRLLRVLLSFSVNFALHGNLKTKFKCISGVANKFNLYPKPVGMILMFVIVFYISHSEAAFHMSLRTAKHHYFFCA